MHRRWSSFASHSLTDAFDFYQQMLKRDTTNETCATRQLSHNAVWATFFFDWGDEKQ